MKVYFIYKVTAYEPYLYAITDNKDFLKSFMKERKKKLFKYTEKNLTKSEWYRILQNHEKYILGEKGFYTQSPTTDSTLVITITATMREEEDVYLKSDQVFLEIGKHTNEIYKTFNDEILKALNTLHYFEIFKFKRCVDEESWMLRGFDPYDCFRHQIDSFNVFCFLYGNTINFNGLSNQIEKHANEDIKNNIIW